MAQHMLYYMLVLVMSLWAKASTTPGRDQDLRMPHDVTRDMQEPLNEEIVDPPGEDEFTSDEEEVQAPTPREAVAATDDYMHRLETASTDHHEMGWSEQRYKSSQKDGRKKTRSQWEEKDGRKKTRSQWEDWPATSMTSTRKGYRLLQL